MSPNGFSKLSIKLIGVFCGKVGRKPMVAAALWLGIKSQDLLIFMAWVFLIWWLCHELFK
ncbi:hypothetical protein PR202_gb29417 [Eleusine coracana subsp. coracana]|uniref:Uncharacterized protein n=1 Tax=Eleusine coracana subsp. coracana TaxID=191504 RepID=A0AAV5FZ95_ELECO|nr:hypothetical protein PR202_gb29417 [Eleusine coracana subsp. coracana]